MDFIGFLPRISICYTCDLNNWPFRYWCFHNWLSFILALAFRKCTNRSNGLCHSKIQSLSSFSNRFFYVRQNTHVFFPKIKTVNFCSKVQKGVSHLPDDLESTKFPPRELFPCRFSLERGAKSFHQSSITGTYTCQWLFYGVSKPFFPPLHKILVFWIYFKIDSIRKEILL